MRTSILLLLCFTAASGRLGCQAKEAELPWTTADSTVVIGGRPIGLRTVAWRDFMPRVGGQPGSDLMVNLLIASRDSAPLPAGLLVDSAWVRSRAGLWRASPSQEERPVLSNGMDLMLRGGPKWATDQAIDVLVRLRLPTGAVFYLGTRGQGIGRTM